MTLLRLGRRQQGGSPSRSEVGLLMAEFIGDDISVRFSKKPGPPTSFVWCKTEYGIAEVKGIRRVLDFRRPWWRRRHRDYYVVRTDTGETFEMYFHRGPGRRYWVLSRRLAAAPPPQG